MEAEYMITKRVQIEFANSNIRAIDHIQDIRNAAESAGLHLFGRYDVQLQYPMPEGDRVVVEVKIPEEIAETFAIGNHLRGLSAYLIKNRGDYYKPYLVGNRLLTYTELGNGDTPGNEFPMAKRLEAISAFAKLLERSDETALDQISRILVILDEAKQPWE